MTLLFERRSAEALSDAELRASLEVAFETLGPRRRVLVVPPDITRLHSFAGRITELAWEHFQDRMVDILPALGTHAPMTGPELDHMFGHVPHELFRVHRWRDDVETLGAIPASRLRALSEGRVEYEWPVQVNRLVRRGGHDLILCVGQVVPHEVAGVAGQSKTLLVGTGGREAIHKSHYLGAVYGMERIMGRPHNPVRALFEEASGEYLSQLPVVYVLTVVGSDERGQPALRGLFVGDDQETFDRAAQMALEVNFTLLEEPLEKVVVYLNPEEFRSTWLGNKAIYRTRMALADGGELVILAPGISRFGEDAEIDRLIRSYGYLDTPRILELVREHDELRNALSAAAHLIHGTSEGRFRITYCPGGLSREEILRANYGYGDLRSMLGRYDPKTLSAGWNRLPDGERIFYVPNPAMGLWAHRDRFLGTSAAPGGQRS